MSSLNELLKTTMAIVQNLSQANQLGSVASVTTNQNKQQQQQQQQQTSSNRHQLKKSLHLSIDKWKLCKDLIPNYSSFPSPMFKRILCKAIPQYQRQFEEYLTNAPPLLLSLIQEYTHLSCIFYQLELEKDYWEHLAENLLYSMKWLRKMPKDLTKRYPTDWNYPRTEQNLRHRQRLTENKRIHMIQELELHFKQYASVLYVQSNSISEILPKILEAALTLLKTGLEKLETTLSQHKLLMQYDANNIELLKSFHDLHTTQQEKLIFQKLWRIQHRFGRNRIHLEQNIPSTGRNNTTTQRSIPIIIETQLIHITASNIHQFNAPSLRHLLNVDIRSILEAHQENMMRRANHILLFKK